MAEILYEDNHIIAVYKRSSDLSQSDKTGDAPIENEIKKYIAQKYGKPGEVFLGIVHRLDRPVSGIMLFARTSKALSRLNEMFKTYVYDNEVKGSKEASLTYRLKGRSEKYYLLEVELHSGRHHQIRAQLAKIGCPVKGDLKYGFPRSNEDGGISLFARKLEFVHPVKKEVVTITAHFPEGDIWSVFMDSVA